MASTDNKYALITGANSNIGCELAELFAQDNYSLVIVDAETEGLQKLAAELSEKYSVTVIALVKDMREQAQGIELINELQRRNLPIEIMANQQGNGEYTLAMTSNVHHLVESASLICRRLRA